MTLAAETDRLGAPRLRIDLRFGRDDAERLVRAHQQLGLWLSASGFGRIEYRQSEASSAEAALALMSHGSHHIGTARMGANRREGVVDGDLACFDSPNLTVLGSAAFPTSGQANPILSIVAFAARLAEKLAAAPGASPVTRPGRARMRDHLANQRIVMVARCIEREFAGPHLAQRRIARIAKRRRERARQRLDVADRRQGSLRRRDEDFRRSAAICGNDRQSMGERFDAGESERLAARRQHKDARGFKPRALRSSRSPRRAKARSSVTKSLSGTSRPSAMIVFGRAASAPAASGSGNGAGAAGL